MARNKLIPIIIAYSINYAAYFAEIYRGGIEGCENYFDLDDHHRFFKDLRLDVCGNSCSYVQDTRFGKYFTIYGDRSIHFGPYEGCGNAPSVDGGGCCGGGCC